MLSQLLLLLAAFASLLSFAAASTVVKRDVLTDAEDAVTKSSQNKPFNFFPESLVVFSQSIMSLKEVKKVTKEINLKSPSSTEISFTRKEQQSFALWDKDSQISQKPSALIYHSIHGNRCIEYMND